MLTTTAFERAQSLGWSIAELARRSGLSPAVLYKLRSGERQPGKKCIEGLLRAFPSLGYRDLFVPSTSSQVQTDVVLYGTRSSRKRGKKKNRPRD